MLVPELLQNQPPGSVAFWISGFSGDAHEVLCVAAETEISDLVTQGHPEIQATKAQAGLFFLSVSFLSIF